MNEPRWVVIEKTGEGDNPRRFVVQDRLLGAPHDGRDLETEVQAKRRAKRLNWQRP